MNLNLFTPSVHFEVFFKLFFHGAYTFGICFRFFSFPYFALRCFYSIVILLVVCIDVCSLNLLKDFFVVLECPVLSILFYPVSISFFFCPCLLVYFHEFMVFLAVLLFFLFFSKYYNLSPRSYYFLFKGAPADHNTQTCCLTPTLHYVSI